jgi:hypothetical protein
LAKGFFPAQDIFYKTLFVVNYYGVMGQVVGPYICSQLYLSQMLDQDKSVLRQQNTLAYSRMLQALFVTPLATTLQLLEY